MDSLELHQFSSPISPRRALEDELGRARAELQSIYAMKLNYYLRDTSNAATDTVIKLLSQNQGNLADAPVLKINAYALKGNYTRAFAVSDSLAALAPYTELMTLQHAILELDSSKAKYSTILVDDDLLATISTYAADSTKAGSAQARSILNQVYNTDPILIRLLIPDGDFSMMNNDQISQEQSVSSKITGPENKLKIYPHPTDNGFNLLYTSSEETVIQYFIKDLLGKEIASGIMNPNISQQIDARQFTNGIYFVTLVENNTLLEKQKLIIMK